jgi:GT2 family glycosyltransferase
MEITVIIVTYADRFNLLKQVIGACFKSGISSIVVVDNDSHKNSKHQLKALLENHKDQITVIWNKSNLGSAKAYKQGLHEAKSLDRCNYIWLLDDDNKPKEKALETLKNYWIKKPKDVAALLSFRPDRKQYKQAILENNPNLVLGRKNSFSGFHLNQKFFNFFSQKALTDNKKFVGEIAYAPYGGMFFHKTIIDEIGYPNEDYFLYSDDHDWSYRITKANKKIYLVLKSVIEDIDTSWGLIDKKSTTFTKIKNAPSLRVYYNVRNRMLFEKNYLVSNNFSYMMNKFTFTLILFCFCFRSKNFKVFKKAVNDADNNNLAKF